MAEIILDGRNISELKVTELKDELEKRRLPKKGVKTVLLNRLRASILKELEVLWRVDSVVLLWDVSNVL